MKEVWKDCPGYVGKYQVSNKGNVKSLKRGNYSEKLRDIKALDKSGYKVCAMRKDNKMKLCKVHRLVMEAFVGLSKLEVNHINGVKTDNRLENLEYVSTQENLAHAKRIGLIDNKGVKNPASILNSDHVRQIDFLYATGLYTHSDLSGIFNVSDSCVAFILQGRSWPHITRLGNGKQCAPGNSGNAPGRKNK